MEAIDIIKAAARRCNKLYPGETLDADTAATMFDDLNDIVDLMSAKQVFLYLDALVTASQTGQITIGSGAWSAIPVGAEVLSVFGANNIQLGKLTADQYATIPVPSTIGSPASYYYNGMSAINLYPIPNAVNITVHVKQGVSKFADQTTDYSAPPGYEEYLKSALAVRAAKYLMGKLPQTLLDDRREASLAIQGFDPAIIDVPSYSKGGHYNPLFNYYL
jgi:hypothetical protein